MPVVKSTVRPNPLNAQAQRNYRAWKRQQMSTASPAVRQVVDNVNKALGVSDPYASDSLR
jgi:hypothetical protein